MQREHIWQLLFCAGVRVGLRHAVGNGETITEHLVEAMAVVRPLMYTKYMSVDRRMYDTLVWEVVAYLMASEEQVMETVHG